MNMAGIELKEIMVDPKLKTREIDVELVKHIEDGIALGETPDPLLVTKVGESYVLLGGHHRLEALRRAIKGAGLVTCRVIECENYDEMMEQALLDNRRNAKTYTETQRKEIYHFLTRDLGWSKKRASNALGIVEERAERYEVKLVKMEATDEADILELPNLLERAKVEELPNAFERANSGETPTGRERATAEELPRQEERVDLRQIVFHVDRLRHLIPAAWDQARAALEMLAERIEEANNE